MAEHRPVRQLSVDVARKIAAGEVIDRPQAIVRELLDNAVDSGAQSITVEIAGGGIEKIRVLDDGDGMTRDDLENCARPHCTSKIVDSSDLMNLSTLGFRGEALASIAAVSRLSITSGTNKMTASISSPHKLETVPLCQNGKGTIVQSEALFENFPARRVFLKRPASETLLCRETFVEKSLPRPDIAFRLVIDGSIRCDLPKDVSLAQRFTRALELKESSDLFTELKSEGMESDGKSKWSFSLVIGEPSVYRNDRKQIYIFVNGRRVQEYSLLQAIEYGCQGFFPNGVHPVAALFLNVNPKLVDFNIHPAKKEVRFRDISSVHHGVSSAVKNYFLSYGIKSSNESEEVISESQELFENKMPQQDEFLRPTLTSQMRSYEDNPWKKRFSHQETSIEPSFTSAVSESKTDFDFLTKNLAMAALDDEKNTTESSQDAEKGKVFYQDEYSSKIAEGDSSRLSDFKFIGTALGTFIIVQIKSTLYFIDQHAAHERILFNNLMAGGGEKQELLIPYTINTDSDEDDSYLESVKDILENIGFSGKQVEKGRWEFSSVPARWTGTQNDLQNALLEFHTPVNEIMYKIAAMTACKAAVKDGMTLDPATAEKLARQALLLSDPHCPHGRPVWTTITKEQLFARVRRT